MKIEEIIQLLSLPEEKRVGKRKLTELKDVEFKQEIPQDSSKYVKTLIAYANTQGGTLIIGVEDETLKVVGVPNDTLFQQMDSIANAVADSCEPQIIPEIEPYTLNGKTIIIVSVPPLFKRPYYLKSKGMFEGTYVRLGPTTRLAYPELVRDLVREGDNVTWDELPCREYEVTEKAINKLLRELNSRRRDWQMFNNIKEKLPPITVTNLENWNILKKTEDGDYLATNAFTLLTSDRFQFSKLQCGVFKGTDKVHFLDKREFTGPLLKQIDEALSFVRRNIRLEVKIKTLVRQELLELPEDAFREMIVNGVCHRNWTEPSCVQVNIYDNRLEVLSPGGLYNGLKYEEAMSGHSKFRNRSIANIFFQIGLTEGWGSGIKRIRDAAKSYGLPEPEFIEFPQSFLTNLYRKPLLPTEPFDLTNSSVIDEKSSVIDEKSSAFFIQHKVNRRQRKILSLIKINNQISASEIAKELNQTNRGVEKSIKKLREKGILIRHGATHGGYWEIKFDEQ